MAWHKIRAERILRYLSTAQRVTYMGLLSAIYGSQASSDQEALDHNAKITRKRTYKASSRLYYVKRIVKVLVEKGVVSQGKVVCLPSLGELERWTK